MNFYVGLFVFFMSFSLSAQFSHDHIKEVFKSLQEGAEADGQDGGGPTGQSISEGFEVKNGVTYIVLDEGIKFPLMEAEPLVVQAHANFRLMGDIPESSDLRSISPPIRNQGDRGTCVAFALAGGVEIAGGIEDLSEQYIYFFNKLIDGGNKDGLNTMKVVERMKPFKIPYETSWPYNVNGHCRNYDYACSSTRHQGMKLKYGGYGPEPEAYDNRRVYVESIGKPGQNLNAIKQELSLGHPVVASIGVSEPFRAAGTDGVIMYEKKEIKGGHAIVLVGHHEDPEIQGGGYFIIRNSWREDWGDEGYGYASYKYMEKRLYGSASVQKVLDEPIDSDDLTINPKRLVFKTSVNKPWFSSYYTKSAYLNTDDDVLDRIEKVTYALRGTDRVYTRTAEDNYRFKLRIKTKRKYTIEITVYQKDGQIVEQVAQF